MNAPRIKKTFTIVCHNPNLVEFRSGIWNCQSHFLEDEQKENKLSEIILYLKDGVINIEEVSKKFLVPASTIEAIIEELKELEIIEYQSSSAIDYFLEIQAKVLSQNNIEPWNLAKLKSKFLFLIPGTLSNQIKEQLKMSSQSEFEYEFINIEELFNDGDEWIDHGLHFEKKLEFFEKWKDYFWIFSPDYIHPILGSYINHIAKRLNVSWLHVGIDGPMLLIGPIFKGSEGPCYNCLEQRILMNLREKELYKSYKKSLLSHHVYNPKNPLIELFSSLTAAHSALELINFICTKNSNLNRKILTIYVPTMEIQYSELLELSSCEVCNQSSLAQRKQLYFDIESLINLKIK
jgi:bacteriocin biosynthesis cyclodehydratase domain-containing protein